MEEKRRYHRMKIEIPMNYRIPPEDKFNITTTLDISGTGVSFTADTKLKIGWEVFMHLLLSDDQEIELRAEVVSVNEILPEYDEERPCLYRTGVRILEPVQFDEKQFIKFYTQHLSAMLKGDKE